MREIHRGAQGVVYEAIQLSMQRKVALKVMRHDSFGGDTAWKRLDREIRLLAQFQHPNVIAIFDSGKTPDGRLFFAMDYVRGFSLRDYLRNRKPALRPALELFQKICEAVDHAHRKGVVHRDLKPANIMIDENGAPKVLDFGLAKSLAAPSDATVSITGQFVGTLPYMSPEQASGSHGTIDVRTDVYSLGVILYELLTGSYPYPIAGALGDILKRISDSRPVPPSEAWTAQLGIAPDSLDGGRPSCPIDKDLETIVLTALVKEREFRYANAGELARDVQRYLKGEPIHGVGESIWYVFKTRCRGAIRRHRLLTHASLIALTAILVDPIGWKIFYDWTGANQAFERWMANAFAPSQREPFQFVRIIEITDKSDVYGWARRLGLDDVSPEHPRSLRRLYGRLMEKLADSGCRAVVWDVSFSATTEYDDTFVRGASALREAGIDVVVGVPKWWFDDPSGPALSANFLPHVKWGSVMSTFDASEPWAVHLVAQRDLLEPLPSLALAGLAAFRSPRTNFDIDLDPSAPAVILRYWSPDESAPQGKRAFGPPDEVKFTQLRKADVGVNDFDPMVGLREEDQIGFYIVDVPSDDVLKASRVDSADVLSADENQLRGWFRGKLVVIGYLIGETDRFSYPNGRRQVPGCFGQAASIEGLLRQVSVRVPFGTALMGVHVLAALLGSLGGFRFARAIGGRILWFSVWTFFLVLASMLVYWGCHFLWNPVKAGVALLTMCEASAALERFVRFR